MLEEQLLRSRPTAVSRKSFGKIIVEAVKEWIKTNFRFLDPERHVIVDYMVRKGSTDLVTVFEAGKKAIPLANDTSIGVGYAPYHP